MSSAAYRKCNSVHNVNNYHWSKEPSTDSELSYISMSLIQYVAFTLPFSWIFSLNFRLYSSTVWLPQELVLLLVSRSKISANLRQRRVWTTWLKDEAPSCGQTRHLSVGFFVPFCKEPQRWRIHEISAGNIARVEGSSRCESCYKDWPLNDAVG